MLTLPACRCFTVALLSRLFSFASTAVATLLLLGLAATSNVSHAAQSYDNCTGFITSIPFTISTQGTWCMNADLATAITSGVAISVGTNNVTIDCNDFKLGGLAAGAGTFAFGINAPNRDNVTVRRCNVRGFNVGINISGGSGHIVEDSRADSNTTRGIIITGEGSIIRRNLVVATGGANIISSSFGIIADGSVDVLDNTINGVLASGNNTSAYGIFTIENSNGSISGNRVRGVVKNGIGVAFGIDNFNSGRITLRNNDVVSTNNTGSFGMRCSNGNGRAMSNHVSGFVNTIVDCTVGAGNEIQP